MNNTNSIKKSKKFDLAFVGLTHLGLVTSICSSFLKFNTLALDQDSKLISELNKSVLKVPEPGLEDLLTKSLSNYYASSNFNLLKKINITFLSLDTSTYKPSDLKSINILIDKIITNLNPGSTLVILSQVPVGYTRKLKQKIAGLNISLYYFLNTLIIGESVKRFLKPERIIIGLNNKSDEISTEFKNFLKKFKAPIIKMSYEGAELTKSAINLYLAGSIIASNTLSDFCEVTGADFNEILPALESDKRIGYFAYLKPTIRISGGHLERELIKLNNLAKKYKISSGIVKPLIELNNQRIKWLIKKITQIVPAEVSKKTITIWGLSYKKNTNSVDNAASIEILKKLSMNYNFSVYDPMAILPRNIISYKRFKNKYAALKNSDLLIILTDWDEFIDIDHKKIVKLMSSFNIIDCVGILKNDIAGLNIISMGRP